MRPVLAAWACLLMSVPAPALAQASACTPACKPLLPDVCGDAARLGAALDARAARREQAKAAYESSPLAAQLAKLRPQDEKLEKEYSALATELKRRGSSEKPRGKAGVLALKTSEIKERLEGVKAKLGKLREELEPLQKRAYEQQRGFAVTGMEESCVKEFALLTETNGKSVDQLGAERAAFGDRLKALEEEKAKAKADFMAAIRKTGPMLSKAAKAAGLGSRLDKDQIAELRKSNPDLDAALEEQSVLARRDSELDKQMEALRAEMNRILSQIRLLEAMAGK